MWQFGDRWCRVVFLQVQTPPHEWEVAVVKKLHSRLQVNGFHTLVSVACTHMTMCDFILSPLPPQSFMQIEKAFRFDNASVIVTPYFCFGSLLVCHLLQSTFIIPTLTSPPPLLPQDLVNAHLKSPSKTMLPETMVTYYTREIISAVATLHQCGILHADIKPDNFMLKNIT